MHCPPMVLAAAWRYLLLTDSWKQGLFWVSFVDDDNIDDDDVDESKDDNDDMSLPPPPHRTYSQ